METIMTSKTDTEYSAQRVARVKQILRRTFQSTAQSSVKQPTERPDDTPQHWRLSINAGDILRADAPHAIKTHQKTPLWPDISVSEMRNPKSGNKTIAMSFAYFVQIRPNFADHFQSATDNGIDDLEDVSSLGHETIHTMQHHFHRLISAIDIYPSGVYEVASALNDTDNLSEKQKSMNEYAKKKWNKTVPEYFSQPIEIQARIHEIMAWGSQQWGRMPQSFIEVQVALMNAGLNISEDKRQDLLSTQEGQKAAIDFAVNEAPFDHLKADIKHINLAYQYADTDELQAQMWDKLYTGLYGSLLEMYGDMDGRAKLGLGSSLTPVLYVAAYNYEIAVAAARQTPIDKTAPLPDALQEAIELISCDDALYLLRYAYLHDDTKAIITELRADIAHAATEQNLAEINRRPMHKSLMRSNFMQ